MGQTIDQKRASSAWNEVDIVNRKPEETRKKYSGLVKKLPAMIHTNSLGQALAFLKAKGKDNSNDPHEIVYKHLQEWLFRNVNWGNSNQPRLIERIISTDSDKYRYATIEALAYLTWLRRFAEAVLPPEDEEE